MEAEQVSLEEMVQRLSELRIDAELTCYVHGARGKLRKIPSVLRKHGRKGGFGADPDFDPDAWEDLADEVEDALEDLEGGPVDTLPLELNQFSDLEAALVIAQTLPELEIAAAGEWCDDEMRLWEYAWFSPAGSRWISPVRGGTDFWEDAEVFPPYSCRPEDWDWGFRKEVYAWAPFECPSEAFFRQWKEALAEMSEEEYRAYCNRE